jgi:hypothetical protein
MVGEGGGDVAVAAEEGAEGASGIAVGDAVVVVVEEGFKDDIGHVGETGDFHAG